MSSDRFQHRQDTILTLPAELEESALAHAEFGAFDDNREGVNQAGNSSYSVTNDGQSRRNGHAYIFVRPGDLEKALMDVINLQEEYDRCCQTVARAFQVLEQCMEQRRLVQAPDKSRNVFRKLRVKLRSKEVDKKVRRAMHDSDLVVRHQAQRMEELTKAQKNLEDMEQCVARQDKFMRESGIFGGINCGGGQSSSGDRKQTVKVERIIERLACVICHDEIEHGSAFALECAHVFHTDCITLWLERKKVCPVCKRQVTAE